MPWKALRICSETGCHKRTREHRCPEHLATWNEAQRKKRMARAGRRQQKGHTYGRSGWRKIRKAQLEREPNCRRCGKPATHVDHIKTKASGGSDESRNLQSLCVSCHSSKTARKDRGFGNRRSDDDA